MIITKDTKNKKEFIFKPNFKLISSSDYVADIGESEITRLIKDENMLFSADINFARNKGGALTNNFLDRLHEIGLFSQYSEKDIIIDSKAVMLMKDWFPAIAGWHHDDIKRYTPNGQPDYINSPQTHHYLMVVGDCSLTQFLNKEVKLSYTDKTKVLYSKWDKDINKMIKNDEIKQSDLYNVKSGDIIYFDSYTFHQAMPSIKDGWRFFIRLSITPNRKHFNEIRKSVNIYNKNIKAGW